MMLEVGQIVPDFVVPATNHKNVHLRALRGYKVLLYFSAGPFTAWSDRPS